MHGDPIFNLLTCTSVVICDHVSLQLVRVTKTGQWECLAMTKASVSVNFTLTGSGVKSVGRATTTFPCVKVEKLITLSRVHSLCNLFINTHIYKRNDKLMFVVCVCVECNCDPSGVVESFSGCGDSPPGELCQCKERVTGRICNECKPLFWNLQQWNPFGCEGLPQTLQK